MNYTTVPLGEHDRHRSAVRGIQHRDDLGGRYPLGERGVATEIGEKNRHLHLDAPKLGAVWVIDERGGYFG